MERIPDDELEGIIERDAPGYKLARPRDGEDRKAARAEPEETSPDIEALRKKYLGEPGNESEPDAAGAAGGEGDGDEAAPEDEIVAVRPEKPGDPFDQTGRPKTVVISGKDRRIVGQQG